MRAYFCAQASARLLAAITLAIVFGAAVDAQAGEVKIPLTIDYPSLTEALKRDLYTAPGGRAALWSGPDPCQFLHAEHPAFARAAARVKLDTAVSLALGVSIAGRCVSPVSWDGIVDAETAPYIAPPLEIRFRIEDVNLYDTEHQKTLLAGQGFDLIKQHLIARLQTFSYNLGPAVRQVGVLAEGAATTPEIAARIRTAMASVRAEPEVAVLDEGLRVTAVIAVPNFTAPAASATRTEPSAAELAAFEKLLDDWDAFVVFAIKQLGVSAGDKQFRNELMNTLIESRYRLVDALKRPGSAAEPDPVRALFLDTWKKLGNAVRRAAARGMLGARSLEFLSFISAGDALFALDQAAPALGMRISAQDLRQLAHIMAPRAGGDPLKFSFDEDQELKRLFGLPEPLRNPGAVETGPPTAPPPNRGARAAPPTSSVLGRVFTMLELRDAGAEEPERTTQLAQTAGRLDRAVVDAENVARYREDMERLLDLAAEREFASQTVDARWHATYMLLVKSAAWQESCWRQFVRAEGRVRWLESSTGDIGLMQVNKRVWRGFYRLERLRWDVLYNAGAGSEILMWMMQYTIAKPKSDPVPIEDHLARSAYAAYNGGPDAYNRWRISEPERNRQVDASFRAKYQALKEGQPVDILKCAAQWGTSPGQ